MSRAARRPVLAAASPPPVYAFGPRVHVARAAYRCAACGGPIPPGARYLRRVGKVTPGRLGRVAVLERRHAAGADCAAHDPGLGLLAAQDAPPARPVPTARPKTLAQWAARLRSLGYGVRLRPDRVRVYPAPAALRRDPFHAGPRDRTGRSLAVWPAGAGPADALFLFSTASPRPALRRLARVADFAATLPPPAP